MAGAYFSLTVDLAESEAELLQAFLPDWGAEALEVRDTQALVMPGVRAPASGESIVVASFRSEQEARTAAAEVSSAFPAARLSIEAVPERDWSVAWRARIQAVRVGRLWVGPPWLEQEAGPSAVPILIEPKMAFGTGDHPTTRLCLQALDLFLADPLGASVLDVGTGTGVLAIAAAKLGAGRVVGVDTDPTSVVMARENAAANGVPGLSLSEAPLQEIPGPFNLVLANILANTLIELAPALAAQTRKQLVLAGVLAPQRAEVSAAFRAQGLHGIGGAEEGEWVRLDFGRPR